MDRKVGIVKAISPQVYFKDPYHHEGILIGILYAEKGGGGPSVFSAPRNNLCVDDIFARRTLCRDDFLPGGKCEIFNYVILFDAEEKIDRPSLLFLIPEIGFTLLGIAGNGISENEFEFDIENYPLSLKIVLIEEQE